MSDLKFVTHYRILSDWIMAFLIAARSKSRFGIFAFGVILFALRYVPLR